MSIADIEMLFKFVGGRTSKVGRRQDETVIGYLNKSPDSGRSGRRVGDSGDSEFVGNDCYGCRFCQCWNYQSDSGCWCYYGCKYRYNDHSMARIYE